MMERFGNYILIERIGSGGMAEVYQALQMGVLGIERIVALKRLHASFSDNERFVKLFLREGKVALQLHHPNIVSTYDFGETDGIYYLAMEFIEGWDLRTLFKLVTSEGEPFPLHASLYIIQSVLRALDYAHNLRDLSGKPLNVVHRDVTPGNIMITLDGVVKLSDFGVARAGISDGYTLGGSIVGKISYLPPEIVDGKFVDRRGDLFSLGVVFLELLTGERVFRGEDFEIMRQIREGYAEKFVSERNFPPPLKEILLKAVATDPAMRYSSAGEFLADLNEFIFHHLYQDIEEEFKKFLSRYVPSIRRASFSESEVMQLFEKKEVKRSLEKKEKKKRKYLIPIFLVVVASLVWVGEEKNLFHFLLPGGRRISGIVGNEDVKQKGSGQEKKRQVAHKKKVQEKPELAVIVKEARLQRRRRKEKKGRKLSQVREQEIRVPLEKKEKPVKKETEEEKVGIISSQPARTNSSAPKEVTTVTVVRKKAGYGFFTILTRPWAKVYIDGEDSGTTPLFRFKLKEGEHTVEVFFPDIGVTKKFKIEIEKDQEVKKVIKMEGE